MKTACEERRKKRIAVCTGAGCRAWDSEKVLCNLSRRLGQKSSVSYEICSSPCLNRCGGGVSVKASFFSQVIKVRSPLDEIGGIFNRQLTSLAKAG